MNDNHCTLSAGHVLLISVTQQPPSALSLSHNHFLSALTRGPVAGSCDYPTQPRLGSSMLACSTPSVWQPEAPGAQMLLDGAV